MGYPNEPFPVLAIGARSVFSAAKKIVAAIEKAEERRVAEAQKQEEEQKLADEIEASRIAAQRLDDQKIAAAKAAASKAADLANLNKRNSAKRAPSPAISATTILFANIGRNGAKIL